MVFNLSSPDYSYKFAVYLLGLGIYTVGMRYWHRNQKLVLVK